MKKIKRAVSLFLVTVMATFCTMPAFAADSNNDFEIHNGILEKYNGSASNVTIPNTVTQIGQDAFSTCGRDLTSVTIPDSVVQIDADAFSDCDGLNITIPDSVTQIGMNAFPSCHGIHVLSSNPVFCDIGGVLYTKDKKTLLEYPSALNDDPYGRSNDNTTYTIPDGVTQIGGYAFSGCNSLNKVIIPDSVTQIGIVAFSYCKSLQDVTVPDSVTQIGMGAFADCDSLSEVTIQGSVAQIGYGAFDGDPHLTRVTALSKEVGFGPLCFSNDDGVELAGPTGSSIESYAKQSKLKFHPLSDDTIKQMKSQIALRSTGSSKSTAENTSKLWITIVVIAVAAAAVVLLILHFHKKAKVSKDLVSSSQFICPKCGKGCTKGAHFCCHCGADLTQQIAHTCPKCGAKCETDAAFCSNCGASLTQSEGDHSTNT